MKVIKNRASSNLKFIIFGILFAFLWSSASTATKIGLESAQPFVIAIVRFLIGGGIMLFLAHVVMRKRLPQGIEWKQLSIYGLFNISLYLGLYVIAMQNVSAGLGSLAVAVSPVMIAIIASIFLKYKAGFTTVLSMLICFAGVVIVAYPLMLTGLTTLEGVVILALSMLSYSIGTLYYARTKWNNLHILTINGWQTIIGGAILSPVLIPTYQRQLNNYNLPFWQSVIWLAIPVSIISVLLWLYLLKENPVKASYWLFLCPIFGFFIAKVFVDEPISLYTLIGVVLVIIGLYILNKDRK